MGNYKNILSYALVIGLAVCFSSRAMAQQVGFGFYTNSELTLTPNILPAVLDFGYVISGQGNKPISITDEETVVLEIVGVAYLDVTVTLIPPTPSFLLLEGNTDYLNDTSRRMPVDIKMAYYNQGQPNIDIVTAKQQAITVTGNTATFQIRRRPGGPPGPPPVPPHANYTPPTATAYLFIFGELTVGNVNAGPYTGDIIVEVEYSTY